MPQYKKLYWTEHSKAKMRQYGLSVSKLLGVLRKPERIEEGIVPETVALMQTNRSSRNLPARKNFSQKILADSKVDKFHYTVKKAPGEVWLMYKDIKNHSGPLRKIISAWRYPGVSKPGDSIPIPEDIRQELIKNHEFQ